MSKISGTIDQVKDDGGSKGKFGWQHRLSICVNDEWYGAFTKKSAEDLGLEQGRYVEFTFTERGEFKNFDPKTLKLGDAPPQAQAPAAPVGKPAARAGNQTAGIKVGHAINNAVQLAIAKGDTSLASIYQLAAEVISLGVVLEARYDSIIEQSADILKRARSQADAPAPKASAPEPTAAPEEPAKAAKPKATPPPPPAPPPPPVVAPDPFDEDDIPF